MYISCIHTLILKNDVNILKCHLYIQESTSIIH